jgi:molybdenum cofactor guanylyltransferase
MLPPFSALLLAAGHSTRMGRDKALLEVGGVPLWRRQREVLARAGAAEILLSARSGQAWSRAAASQFAAIVSDDQPNAGPLAGIAAGLERATHPHLAVLAIDLPRLTPEWLAARLAECPAGAGIVAGRGDFFEPLAAIYPREFKPLARAALARGDHSLQRLVAEAVAQRLLRVHAIPAEEAPLFENWNEPLTPPA